MARNTFIVVVYHVVGIFDIRLFGGLRGRPVPSVGPLGLGASTMEAILSFDLLV